jgi:hypothetical protein
MYRSMVSCNPKTKGFLLYTFRSSIFLFFYSRATLYTFYKLQNRTSPNFSSPRPHLITFALSDYRAALNRPNPDAAVILMSLVNQSSVAPFTDRFISCNPRTAWKKKVVFQSSIVLNHLMLILLQISTTQEPHLITSNISVSQPKNNLAPH